MAKLVVFSPYEEYSMRLRKKQESKPQKFPDKIPEQGDSMLQAQERYRDQPVSMEKAFGEPPSAIKELIAMEVDNKNGTIYFINSELLPRRNPDYRNYVRTAIQIANYKYPDYKIETKIVPAEDFGNIGSSSLTL